MPRLHGPSRALALSLVVAASLAVPVSAQSPEPAASPSPSTAPAVTVPATLTWQRLPDDPRFGDAFAPRLDGASVLADGSIVVVGARNQMVVVMDTGLGSNAGSWALPPGATTWGFASPEAPGTMNTIGLVQGPAGLVAVSDRGTTWTSTDGLAWTPADVPNARMGDPITTDTGYAAVELTNGEPALWTSADGVAWRAAKLGKVGGGGTATQVAHMPGVGYLMAGNTTRSEPLLWSSADGTSWKAVPVPVRAKKKHTLIVTDIAAGPAGFLLVIGDYSSKEASAGLWMSPDGETWQHVAAHDGWLTAVTAVGDGFLAAGPGVVLTSPDGMTWTTTPEPLFDSFRVHALSVAADGRVIAAGFVPNGFNASQAAIWVGTPGAGGPIEPIASPDAQISPAPSASPVPASSAPVAIACLDKKAYDMISSGLNVPDFARADLLPPVADALAVYDPSSDPKFKGVAKFLVLRDRIVEEIRAMAQGDMSGAQKTYVDLMTLLNNHSVRVCK